MNIRDINKSWYFLIAIVLIYAILLFTNKSIFLLSMNFFYGIIKKIIPIFVAVFFLMTLTNYFTSKELITNFVNKKGILKWLAIIIAGIISHGPIYMWYPLLADLKGKGLSYGLVACFLYNRAIKIPLLPLMVLYFSFKYVLILALVMISMSVVQGLIINKLMEVEK
jgi:uncharacterized membrane protein YraQ (UPF0718 family)